MRDPDGYKMRILDSLDNAKAAGEVDADIIPLLDRINSFDDWITTSSCSGRFQVISTATPGDKVGSRVLGKWHREVEKEEVLGAIGRWDSKGGLHLMVQPLLIHIRCLDIPSAVGLRNIGQGAGIKYCSIRSLKLDRYDRPTDWGITVEMMGTERAEIPLHGLDRGILNSSMGFWADYGNRLLLRTKGHIDDLNISLKELTD